VQSFLGVSLTVAEERLGVLFLNYNRPRNFTEEEKATARTFANHAATALKRTKMLKYVQRIRKAAESVARVTVIGDVKQTLDALVKGTKVALGCDAVVLYDYDRATQTLGHPPYMDGVIYGEAARRFEEVDRKSIVYLVLQRDEAVFIERAWEAPLTEERRFRKDEGIKSVVGIPLSAGGEKVGVMFVNYRHEHHFKDDEKESIALFANQAAVAIRNAQLYEEQKGRLNNQDALLELTKELLGKEGVDESMQAVVATAAELLQVEFCAIVLPEEEGDHLVFNAVYGWDEAAIKPIRLQPAYGSQTGYMMETGKPVVVHDFHEEQPFKIHPLIKDLEIRSSLCVPMRAGGLLIGALLVHTRKLRHFDPDIGLLTLIANQASIAMQRARQFEEVNRKRRGLAALYEASKAITASFRPDREMILSDQKQVLDEIIKQAVEGITSTATLGMIKLYDAAADEFSFESVYPETKKEALLKRISDLAGARGNATNPQPRGVVWRAVEQKAPLLIGDVSECEFYLEGDPSTRSQLVVPLILDQRVRGVINLESDRINGFDKDDLANLQALAELAVVVIKNSELFNELIETKSIVDSSNALALMGMTSSIWRHAIKGHAINIRNLPTLMRLDTEKWNLDPEQFAKFEERLKFIESMAAKILHKEAIPPLSYESTTEVASINDLIRDRVVELWKTEPHSNAEYALELADEKLTVRISPDWWRIALDILIDNAVSAVRGRTPSKITICTRRSKNEIHISVSDTGRGIPAEKLPYVLKRPLGADLRSEGLGVGLLIAKTIVETYKGKISLQETSSNGTTFNINLPAAD